MSLWQGICLSPDQRILISSVNYKHRLAKPLLSADLFPVSDIETSASRCQHWMWRVMIVVIAILVATATVPLIPVNWWWVRIGDFPRLQLLVSYLIALSTLVFFWRCRGVVITAGLLILSSCIQLSWIHSYLPIADRQVEDATSHDPNAQLRILASNVLQSNDNATALIELIRQRDPDLVVLCEVNQRWIEQLAPLDEMFSFQLKHPLENEYGIALYSRLDVPRAEVRAMIKESIPSIDADVILPTGQLVRVFAVHPNPPRPGEDTTKRDAELVLVGREVRDDPTAIVLGDLNDVGWSRTTDLFQEVSGLLDPRIGRGFYSTFDATSWMLRYPLDYVFHSDDFRVAELEVLPSIGSDHFPLWIQLSHEPAAKATQEGPEFDAGDLEDAEQAVQAAKELEPGE